MQAITVKTHGPTNHNGQRVSARAAAGRVVVGWDHSLNVEQNYAAAVMALCDRLGWGGTWTLGTTPDGHGVAVCLNGHTVTTGRAVWQ